MGFKYFKYFEKDALGDGAVYEDTWYPDEDIAIKRIYTARKDGSSFTKSTIYLKVKETVYTHDVCPAVVLGPNLMTSPELNIPVLAKQMVKFTFKNLEGAAIGVMITLECWDHSET